MKWLLFMMATVLLSCKETSSAKKENPGNTDTAAKKTDTITESGATKVQPVFYTAPDDDMVNDMLAAKFGTKWHVVNDREAKWMKEAFEYFIVPKRKEYPNYPYITKGDFNGDGKQDIAAVVTDSAKSNYQVAIIMEPGIIKLWDEDILVTAALSTISKAETITQGDIEKGKVKKIKMKIDGINVEYFEQASFVVYLDKSTFKRIQTGD